MGFFDFLKSKTKPEQIIDKYYKNYPRKPYISPDRDFDDWEMRVSTFPNMLVQREMMIPYDDGLLPGHVRMLYWIKNIHRDRIPEYFEYEHGINFEEELKFLIENGYVLNGSVTMEGDAALGRHADFLNRYYPRPETQGGATPIKKQLCSTDDVNEVIKYINEITKKSCQTYNVPVQKINPRILDQKQTRFEDLPDTPSGKRPKYPRVLHYASPASDKIWQFGEIWFLEDGTVGKTKQIYWKNGEGIFIYFGQSKKELVLKKVERSVPLKSNTHEILYKE